jgi:RHS repeat-associated protein
MISLRHLILATTLLTSARLVAGVNDPIPSTGPGPGPCESKSTGNSPDPTIKSLNWSINVGLATHKKPDNLTNLHRVAFEKDGNLPTYQELFDRSFSTDPQQQEHVRLWLSQSKISADTFHPSCLSVESDGSFDVLVKPPGAGPAYIHQILTNDAFTLIEIPEGAPSGWRVRVWNRKTVAKPKMVNGFYETTEFIARLPLNDIVVLPASFLGFNRLTYWQSEFTGVGGVHAFTYDIQQVLDLRGRPITVDTKKYSGTNASGPLLSEDIVTYSGNSGNMLWDYNIVRKTLTASVDAAGTIGPLAVTASTLEEYKDYSIGTAGNTAGGQMGMKRLLAFTQAYDLPGQTPQRTSHTYVDMPENPAVHGRLLSTTRPDGSWVYNEYDIALGSPVSISTEYSGWKNLGMDQRNSARKTVTFVEPKKSEVRTTVAGQVVSWSKNTLSTVPGSPVIMTSENWDGSAWHTTTTAYSVGGPPVILWIENSDGSAVTYGYKSSGNEMMITKRSGAGSRTGITSGTQTVTSVNLGNYPTSEVTTDIATNRLIERWDTDLGYNSGFDALGRPIKRIYNADVTDYDITQYACCGLDYFRSRMGMTTQYFRDELKRVYKTETKASDVSPMVTDFTTIAGLAQTRTRSIGGQLLFMGFSSRSLDGLTRTTTGPARKSALAADRPVTTSVTSHSLVGDTETTTFADGSTSITANYLDGRTKSITGTAVPDMTFDYATHTLNGGGETIITTASGVVTSQFKDLLTRPIKVVSGTTGTSLYTYYPTTATSGYRGKLATMTDGDNVASTYGYDAEGQLTTTARTIPLASGTATQVTTTTRDVVANVLLQGRNLGVSRRQTQTLAATGLPTVTTSESFVATAGLVTGSRSLGRETLSVTTRPDASGISSTTTTQPDGTKSLQIRTHGLVTAMQKLTTTGSIVTATTFGYDTLQRLITSTDARTGTTTMSALTESGQPLTTTTPANLATTIACDVMGRKISTTLPDATVSYTSYYPTGQVKATWGSQTYPTWYSYDEQNRLSQLSTWKVAPVLTATTNIPPAGSDVTTWIYGPTSGLLTRKQYADAKGTDYTYTAAGRLATRAWARTASGSLNRVTTTYSYNQGLLTLTDYSDSTPDVAISYDCYGRQSSVTQANQSKITYSYNPTTLVLASELVNYGFYQFSRTLDRSRDTLLRDTGFQLKSGNWGFTEASATYSYSATDGRIAQVSDPLIPNQLFSYSYTPSSNLPAQITGPIHTVTNIWEPNRDVLDIKQNKVGTTVISSYDYSVNAIGQRTGVTTSGTAYPALPSWLWTYDDLGQVTKADSNVNTSDRRYQYDTIGNRTLSVDGLAVPIGPNYESNALNQYTRADNSQSVAIRPTYDFDGNATAYPLAAAPATNSTLTYDAENRVTQCTVNGVYTGYAYDAQSRRISKIEGLGPINRVTVYLYDAWNCIAEYALEYNGGAAPYARRTKIRLWGTDLSGTPQSAGGVSGLLSETVTSTVTPSYPTYDGNGNISEYLTATGTIAAHFEYDPFGNTVVNTDTGNLFTYRFSTKPRDKETGLYYYGYRYYDPKIGRWPSRDPIGERGGLNLYGMVRNRSINSWDYLGLSEDNTRCCDAETIAKGKAELEEKYRKAYDQFKAQGTQPGGVNAQSCKNISGAVLPALGPVPKCWTCKEEAGATNWSPFAADHQWVTCKSNPKDGGEGEEIAFDYWGGNKGSVPAGDIRNKYDNPQEVNAPGTVRHNTCDRTNPTGEKYGDPLDGVRDIPPTPNPMPQPNPPIIPPGY